MIQTARQELVAFPLSKQIGTWTMRPNIGVKIPYRQDHLCVRWERMSALRLKLTRSRRSCHSTSRKTSESSEACRVILVCTVRVPCRKWTQNTPSIQMSVVIPRCGKDFLWRTWLVRRIRRTDPRFYIGGGKNDVDFSKSYKSLLSRHRIGTSGVSFRKDVEPEARSVDVIFECWPFILISPIQKF